MAAPGVVVPQCVSFCPEDKDVIQKFLLPKIRKQVIPLCLIETKSVFQTVSHPGALNSVMYPYFEPGEVWLFIKRKPVKKNSLRVNRKLEQLNQEHELEHLGKWKTKGRKKDIFDGNTLIGYKQKLLLLNDGLQTGWSMFEYIRKSKKFQRLCVGHLIFDESTVQNGNNSEEEDAHSDAENHEEEAELINQDQEVQNQAAQINQDQEVQNQGVNLELSLGIL